MRFYGETDMYREAVKKRDDFLKTNPHLIEKQQVIDELLNKCKDEDRFPTIILMLAGNLNDLKREMRKLQGNLNNK